jgi:TPR repeat protein
VRERAAEHACVGGGVWRKARVRDGGGERGERGAQRTRVDAELASFRAACAGMAELMMRGQGTSKDYTSALKRAEEACKAEDPYGCHLAGEIYLGGLGTKVDPVKALSNFKTACKGSVPHACLQAAVVEAQSGAAKDPAKAIATFTKFCEQDKFTAACYQLAKAYEDGRLVERSYEKAEGYYKKTCDVGDIEGCFGLARLYEDGKVESAAGAEQAVSIYDKACNAGNTDACARLGKLYIKGKKKDYQEKVYINGMKKDHPAKLYSKDKKKDYQEKFYSNDKKKNYQEKVYSRLCLKW